MERDKKRRKYKGAVIGLSIATGVLGLSTIGLAIANSVYMSQSMQMETQLDNVYKKSLYDLVESVNNAEIKLSKVLSSEDKEYQKKMLTEVVQNAELAENSISALPITQNSLADSVKFINQMGGYSSTVLENLASASKLSIEERANLEKIYNSLINVKGKLDEYLRKTQAGYNFAKESMHLTDDGNSFTVRLSMIKDVSVDYPTMIYDGPFSDSENNYIVKGLKGEVVDKAQAENVVVKNFKNISNIEYAGEINSNFETYNFSLETTDDHNIFVQVSKIGGNILTVSGYNNEEKENVVNIDEGAKIALDFVGQNGISKADVVWRDVLGHEAYYNIAPVQNGIILYPDLVKVKIDLTTGTVIGYDATTYFINHIDRNLEGEVKNVEFAKKHLPAGFDFGEGRKVLAPLDYSREVVCYEFKADRDGETYYFYINAVNGKTENILKVVETTEGSKLM